jgi:hypothetical protein
MSYYQPLSLAEIAFRFLLDCGMSATEYLPKAVIESLWFKMIPTLKDPYYLNEYHLMTKDLRAVLCALFKRYLVMDLKEYAEKQDKILDILQKGLTTLRTDFEVFDYILSIIYFAKNDHYVFPEKYALRWLHDSQNLCSKCSSTKVNIYFENCFQTTDCCSKDILLARSIYDGTNFLLTQITNINNYCNKCAFPLYDIIDIYSPRNMSFLNLFFCFDCEMDI